MAKDEPKTTKAAAAAAAAEEKISGARAKNLDIAIQQIQKDFGEGSIMRLGSVIFENENK